MKHYKEVEKFANSWEILADECKDSEKDYLVGLIKGWNNALKWVLDKEMKQ